MLVIQQTRIVTLVAKEALKEFPSKAALPSNLYKKFQINLRQFLKNILEMIKKSEEKSLSFETEKTKTDELFASWIIGAAASFELENSFEWDLESLICAQELVMLFAHLEAFMADSLRTICYARPDVLKGNKMIDWNTILSCGGWDELLDHLIERYVYEIGWESIQKRVNLLNQKFGLKIKFPETELKLIEEAEQIRHILVHNGGRINKKFITMTGRDDLVIDEPIKVKPKYVHQISIAMLALTSEIFRNVSEKFFGIKEPKFTLQHQDSVP